MEYQSTQEFFQKFPHDWPKEGSYYVWGAWNFASRMCSLFDNQLHIIGFIDSDKMKWGTHFMGCPVVSPDEVPFQQDHVRCIVASLAYGKIRQELERRGLEENVDFCSGRQFIAAHQWADYQKVCLTRVELAVTSCCNLRCRNCSRSIPYYKQHRHYPVDTLLADVDAYFRWVDSVGQFIIYGGEPFLHPDIAEFTEKMAERYHSKIQDLIFLSNGTIIPEKRQLEVMKQYKIHVQIGDYRKGIPTLQPKVDSFIDVLETYGIDYSLPISDMWLDFNHTPEDRSSWDDEKLKNFCKECCSQCRGLYNQKYYFCDIGGSAALAGLYPEEPGDYFDLSGPADTQKKEALIAFDLDGAPKQYVSYCRNCGGFPAVNQQFIPVAEQLPVGHQGRL
ncbi:MAG: radical SAM protein [Oscillospiraceae bacterium]|nr:radical SAM protein [Oscillospiraceae bacterium]